jgi:hypothetical protein
MSTVSNQHFDDFIQQVWVHLASTLSQRSEAVFEVDPHPQHYFFNMLLTQDGIAVLRTVKMSRVDLDGMFHIELSEALPEPRFVMSTEKFHSGIGDSEIVSFSFRRIYNFLARKLDPKKVVPAEMVFKAAEINKMWLHGDHAEVVPYYASDEFDDAWKFKLVNRNYPDFIYTHYLSPETADGILYRQIVRSYHRGHANGMREGALRAAENAAKQAFTHVIEGSPLPRQHLPDEARQFMVTGFLPNPLKPLDRNY